MDNFDHRQDERALSIASIARLEKLQKILEVAANLTNKPQEMRDVSSKSSEKFLSERHSDCPKSLFVGPEYEGTARNLITSIEDVLRSLTEFHDQAGKKNQTRDCVGKLGFFDEEKWTLGTVVFRIERRSVLRGNIDLCKTEPIGVNVPQTLVQYLVAIPGTKDQLIREKHGHWGYHYHYLDDRERRSDTLLTFDHRISNTPRPFLWWERHSEREKFKARADRWGIEKRESVYSVCVRDTSHISLQNFKRPKAEAQIVWP